MTGLLTAQQVAELLGVSERYVWRLGREGQLPRVKIGAHVRFDFDDLEAYVEGCKEGARPAPTVLSEPLRPRARVQRREARRRL